MSTRSTAAATVFALLAAALLAATATAAPPANTALPTISGTPTVGQTVTAGNGSWSNSPTAYEYQWLRCASGGASCTPIAGQTQKEYTVVAADGGRTLRVRVRAVNADGTGTADSEPTVVVTGGAGAPRATDRPDVSGTPEVGETLTADEGTWSGSPTSYTFQWQRCDADNIVACLDVPGADGRTYLARSADLGYRIRVRVVARNASGRGAATSSTTAVIRPKLVVRNHRPSVAIVSVRVLGNTVYTRFRVCDDSNKNLTVVQTGSKPGKAAYSRRFSTLTAPRPCGVYSRHWTLIPRLRSPGRLTVALVARDKSGFSSAAARRTIVLR
jgi:hypothetical protein